MSIGSMAVSLEQIAQPVQRELDRCEVFYRESLTTNVPLLREVIQHILKQKGKQLRPLLITLSAAMHGEINERVYLSSAAIEMLHTATLVHDDVVDNAEERRGLKSINALWRSKVAVLVGDYFLAQALMLITSKQAFDLLEIMTLPIKRMSEGELLQIEKSRSMDTTEEAYFEIINKKTAVLIAACAAIGAKAVEADDETVEKMRQVGEALGIAFQIRDDVFDYQKTNLIGKPTGNDVVERKITLPLIYALKQVDEKQQKHIISLVANAEKNKKNVGLVRDFVIANRGLEYAGEVANNYRDKAIAIINQFDNTPAQQAMLNLAYYITERRK